MSKLQFNAIAAQYSCALLAAICGSLIFTASNANAADHGTCDWYASEASSQQDRNASAGCGYIGARWHNWRDAHYTWCRVASNSKVMKEHNRRESKLSKCGA
ncbi:MAG: hypothetical protein KDJ47_07695 [Hyphomicrobiaceae bacterium]|nr:hypothetical protein [Hyphomicrobiaceae bacterium]